MSATPPPTKAKKPSVKEQRAAERQRKLEEFRLREAKSRRNRLIAIWGGSIAAVVVVGLLITSIVLTRGPLSENGGRSNDVFDQYERMQLGERSVASPHSAPTILRYARGCR